MSPRYKATEEDPTPEHRGRGRRYAQPQAAPRPRLQPARPEPDPYPEEEEPLPPRNEYTTPTAPRRAPEPAAPPPQREEPPRPDPQPRPAPQPRPETREAPATLPGSWREFAQSLKPAEDNPLQEVIRPPKKGMTLWRGVWLFCTFPFRFIYFVTRTLPKVILWPLRFILSFAFVGLFAMVLVGIIYGIKAGRYDITQIHRMPERSIVLDRRGEEVGTLHGENRRSITNLHAEVPSYFIDALILQEDRSFFTHGGVDFRGVMRAVGQVFKHHRTTQGASTLTMQLAKTTYNHRNRNFDAKLTEMALARRIESTFDKQTILTCYINRIFWGHTFMGLKQAAAGYFNKTPMQLTLGEAAMLAGIICSPNVFSPYHDHHAAVVQRDKVLNLMFEYGKISKNQLEAALAEPLVTSKPEPRGTDNYALDLVRSEVDHILDMLEKNNRGIKEETVYAGGLRVQTTLDLDLQDGVMQELDTRLTAMFENNRKYPHQTRAQFQAQRAALPPEEAEKLRPRYLQAACVILDNATGALLAVVGGRDSGESPLNRAVQSRRQVGSIFKPFVYSSFFERGGTENTLVSDDRIQPGEIAGARNWRPGNADGRFTGVHPAGWGLLKSRNTMTVRIGNRAGLSNVATYGLMAGFPLATRPKGPTIYLGTWEASPLEVAGAFTIFANGGVRPTPFIIERITDAEGRVLWQNQPEQRRVFSRATAVRTSTILQQITKPGGTAGSMQRLGFTAPCGGKTGTTNNYKNAWFCGFTSDLTAAVWVGFDRPATIADRAYGGTVALPLWVGDMQRAAARGYRMGEIRTTPATQRGSGMRLCRKSGLLAHTGCEHAGTAYSEPLADPAKHTGLCTAHSAYSASDEDDIAVDPDETPDIDGEDPVAEEVP